MPKRTTIYLDPKLHQAIKLKAVQINISISELVNEAVRSSLKEDAIDLGAVKDRAHEPVRSFESVLKDLKRDGLL
ncbi:MAG: CopG family transcriptional regulator [Omnitrophica bacterium RIFCSPHIGHO2_02_FULL_49_9]|nr:MAG: CopG family transcriptional regulator [Omnitrophica bacterium RIFCSPHIGHO2_02_FULL_49_9]OGW88692.1 MAG: CopG family transcriptional regulator [Omnitrophica bacterium RIFCSPLOWO2_01_FULL_50_24]